MNMDTLTKQYYPPPPHTTTSPFFFHDTAPPEIYNLSLHAALPIHPLPGPAMRNANFEQGAAGWSVTRGRMSVVSIIDGQGASLLLTADDAATAWVQQTVAADPRSEEHTS